MATNTSIKVATNTGAAKDDVLTSLLTGLTEDSRIASLNVLANDPGAARLYSLAQNVSGTSSSTFPVAGQGISALGATLSMNADGTIKYDASSVNLQYLSAGQKITDTFTYTVRMANGAVSTASVTVDLVGQNDGPVITNAVAAARGSVTEDVALTVTGQLSASDVDNGATQAWSIVGSAAGIYGALAVNAATGKWVYSLDNAANQALAAGESHTETFTVRVMDDQGAFVNQQVSVVVNGTNDGPVMTNGAAATQGSVTEDAALTATGQLGASDVDHGATQTWSVQGSNAGAYGNLTVNASGVWSYALNSASANVQALAQGEHASDSFVVRVTDDKGAFVDQVVNLAITGTNDAASISGNSTGAVTEDTTLSTSGTLAVADVDQGQAVFQAQTNAAGTYGSFSIGANGNWTYALNNGAANVQTLAAGVQASDSFTVVSQDGTASQIVNVAITGTNDAASISGNSTGAVTEDTTLSTSGTLAVADVDHGQAVFQAQTNAAGTYGSFSIGANGNWTYALNNGAANVQTLNTSNHVSDSFTVLSQDGTASQLVTVNVNGLDDNRSPVAANDLVEGSVTQVVSQLTFETGTYSQTYGQYNYNTGYYDYTVTTGDFVFTGNSSANNGYGSGPYVIGYWGADYSNTLFSYGYGGYYNGGASTTTPIAMKHADGSSFSLASANITSYQNYYSYGGSGYETVTGYSHGVQVAQQSFNVPNANNGSHNNLVTLSDPGFNSVDKVVFSLTNSSSGGYHYYYNYAYQFIDNVGVNASAVALQTEDRTVDINVLGNDTDADVGDTLSVASFAALSAQGAAITLNANGTLHYDPTHVANLQALAVGETLTDTFTYTAKDQTGAVSNTATVSVVLHGANDAASISGVSTGFVTEDVTLQTTGQLVVSDVDHGEAYVRAQSNVAGNYGSFSIAADGNWTYALNNGAANVQALAQSQHVSDSFTVTSADGTATQQVSVDIAGSNDAPVAANDTISGGFLTFEEGTYSQSYGQYNYNTGNYDYTVTTGDFVFTADSSANNGYGSGPYVTGGYWGADYSSALYSYGYGGYYYGNSSATTTPIAMTHVDGSSFSLSSANITAYQDYYYSYGGSGYETVTGYSNGVQVAQQSFYVPDAYYGTHNNVVTFTDPGFNSVDKVVFSLTTNGGGNYYGYDVAYQWIDNIALPNTVAQSRDVNVLANDSDIDGGSYLSVGSFSGFSAHGAAISLNADGTLRYDPTVSAELQALSQGTNVYDSFTYQAQDEFGALSNYATVGINVVGVAHTV